MLQSQRQYIQLPAQLSLHNLYILSIRCTFKSLKPFVSSIFIYALMYLHTYREVSMNIIEHRAGEELRSCYFFFLWLDMHIRHRNKWMLDRLHLTFISRSVSNVWWYIRSEFRGSSSSSCLQRRVERHAHASVCSILVCDVGCNADKKNVTWCT